MVVSDRNKSKGLRPRDLRQLCLLVVVYCASCGTPTAAVPGTTPTASAISGATPTTTRAPGPTPHALWIPPQVSAWQWILASGPLDTTVNVPIYDIDGFERSAADVAALHAKGRHVICYISVGTYETFRPDAGQFPASVLGKALADFPNERWLDIRQLNILGPIMLARLDMCKAKGFDAVEPDNVDGYSNASGFPLGANDQLTYNRFIADAAHARGLSVGLKNDLNQVGALLASFDWALNEQCFEYQECAALQPFLQAGKAVFEVEYNLPTSGFCPQANALNLNAMLKHLGLDAYRQACR